MKTLMILSTLGLLLPTITQAAITKCEYQKEACDNKGNHYQCYMYGWIGPGEVKFCSTYDQSTFKSNKRETDYCYEECGRSCLESPVFCGGW